MADKSTDQTGTAATETTESNTNEVANSSVTTEEVVAQAEKPDAVQRALQAERAAAKKAREEAKELAVRLKEYEDRDKTDQERLAEERDTLKAKLGPLELENLRLRVASEKKLPAELTDRLQGADREAMEADAEALLALVATTAKGSRGSADIGARGEGTGSQITREQLKNMKSAEIVKAQTEGRLDHLLRGD